MPSKIDSLKKEHGGVLVTQEEFAKLPDYAPKKTEIGVSWKQRLDAGSEEYWVMGTYVPHPEHKEGYVGVKWAFIEIASPSEVLAFRKAAKEARERAVAKKPSAGELTDAFGEFEESVRR